MKLFLGAVFLLFGTVLFFAALRESDPAVRATLFAAAAALAMAIILLRTHYPLVLGALCLTLGIPALVLGFYEAAPLDYALALLAVGVFTGTLYVVNRFFPNASSIPLQSALAGIFAAAGSLVANNPVGFIAIGTLFTVSGGLSVWGILRAHLPRSAVRRGVPAIRDEP